MIRLVIADDQAVVRAGLSVILGAEEDIEVVGEAADGAEVGRGRVDRTVPAMFSLDEGTDVGLDSLDPVVDDYGVDRGRFTGTIDAVTIDIRPDAHEDPDMVVRARMRKQ